MKYNLSFISEENLSKICADIISAYNNKHDVAENDFYKNIIDPFSAIFDASVQDITLKEWKELEKIRQAQKSLQNNVGGFHQKVIGCISGWEDLGTGKILDLRNSSKKILAEVKNKFNTTKGNHKSKLYDDIECMLSKKEYKSYTGYYVSILNKGKFDKPFTPSDNTKSDDKKRKSNDKIREIDGASFYEIATGDPHAIKKLYTILPYIISSLSNSDVKKIIKDPLYNEFFFQAFK